MNSAFGNCYTFSTDRKTIIPGRDYGKLQYTLNNSMEQSPSSEAVGHSTDQKIPLLSLNPKVHYCVHKGPPLDPTLRQMNPAHTLTSYFFGIHFNIISPLYLHLQNGLFPLGFPSKVWMHFTFPCVLHIWPTSCSLI
jgi:hypothetical protein